MSEVRHESCLHGDSPTSASSVPGADVRSAIVKRGVKIAISMAIPVVFGVALFFANEANLFPHAARSVKSLTDVTKIWGAGNYLCARGRAGGVRCAMLGITANGVENAIGLTFLEDPVAMVEDAPNVCALERGQVLCWNMARPMLGGLGLVYSQAQRVAGTIDHGSLPRIAARPLPLSGVRELVSFGSMSCALSDSDGVTCFKYEEGKSAPEMVFKHAARKLLVTPDKDLLCIDEVDAIVCYENTSSTPISLVQRFRLLGIADVTTVSTNYSSVCSLGSGGVFCAERRHSSGSGAIEELRLTHVDGLASPTKLWSTGLAFAALDGTKVIKWDDRGVPAPKDWGALAPGDAVYDGIAEDWFLYRNDLLLRVPSRPWPRRYDLASAPSQLVQVGLATCALVGSGSVSCFRLLSRRHTEPGGLSFGVVCAMRTPRPRGPPATA